MAVLEAVYRVQGVLGLLTLGRRMISTDDKRASEVCIEIPLMK